MSTVAVIDQTLSETTDNSLTHSITRVEQGRDEEEVGSARRGKEVREEAEGRGEEERDAEGSAELGAEAGSRERMRGAGSRRRGGRRERMRGSAGAGVTGAGSRMRGSRQRERGSAEASGASSAPSKGSQRHRPGGCHVSHRNGNNAVLRPHLGVVSHRKGNNALLRPHLDDFSHRNGKYALLTRQPLPGVEPLGRPGRDLGVQAVQRRVGGAGLLGVPQPLQVGLGDPGPGGRTGHGLAFRSGGWTRAGPRAEVNAGNRTRSADSVRAVDRAVEGPNSAGPTSGRTRSAPRCWGGRSSARW